MLKKRLNGLIIKIYNHVISLKIINKNSRLFRRIREMFLHNICWKCEASFGKKNPDRLFYVIRSGQSELGFFGLFNYVVDGIIDAVSVGAEPVVDWQYYPNDYLCDDAHPCKKNAWEEFFLPMSGISIEEVYSSKNVIMSNSEYLNGGKVAREYTDKDALEKTSKLINQYITLKEDLADEISAENSDLRIKESRVLGVKLRGTDFKETKPKHHCICPDVEYTANAIDRLEKEKGKFDRIYIVTEDKQMLDEMIIKYGNRIICSSEKRLDSVNGQWINKMYDGRDAEYKYKSMREYLKSVYLLSECDSLVAPIVGATNGAMRIKGGYANMEVLSLGIYE